MEKKFDGKWYDWLEKIGGSLAILIPTSTLYELSERVNIEKSDLYSPIGLFSASLLAWDIGKYAKENQSKKLEKNLFLKK